MAKAADTPDDSANIPPRISTGSEGLDAILGGGLDVDRLYLFEGRPGTGKTTLALQFLLEGVRQGETTLYVSLSETEQELRVTAQRHGWSLDGIDVFELVPPETALDPSREITVLHPGEVELTETVSLVFERVTRLNPSRVVFDSLSELRLLAQNPLRFRRQILAMKHFFVGRSCTVIMLDDLSSYQNDLQIHSLAHGVVLLEQIAIDYGTERRRMRIVKMRGSAYKGGFHDLVIRTGGLTIFPRLVSADHHRAHATTTLPSGRTELDSLLGGGLESGTSALVIGSAGVGKTTLALAFVLAAAEHGQRAALFTFDEGQATIVARAKALGMSLDRHLDSGAVHIRQIDPAEMSPGEFADLVRQAVEENNASVVVIDSLNGYLAAMPDERFLILQMHELLNYLSNLGVITILVLAQYGLVGSAEAPLDISYLSDSVLLLRYFEASGEIRRAISVIKKRSGAHETTIREFRMSEGGIILGEPLREFTGVLSGTPQYFGSAMPLLPK